MFTIEDIRNIAIQIEKNGEKIYRKLAESSKDPEIRKFFSWMADEEQRHARWFAHFKITPPTSPEQAELAEMGKNLLQEMVKDQTFSLDTNNLAQSSSLHELIAQVKEFELDTATFYEFIENLMTEENHREKLQQIIEEEKKHAQTLEELLELTKVENTG